MHAAQGRHDRVEDALGDLVAVGVQDRVGGHQVPDVAHEQQRPAVQHQLGAVESGVDAVGVHGAGEGLAVLGDLLGEIAAHEAQPVAVPEDLVLGVDGGDGVLEVHDGGDGRFDQHVLHPGGVGAADGTLRVDLQLEVQTVVAEQDPGRSRRLAGVADEQGGIGESGGLTRGEGDHEGGAVDHVGRGIDVRARRQRQGLVEERAGVGDDLVAADPVVGRALLGAVLLGDRVRAVQGVVQRAPPGVGGVEGEAGVEHRHHQLRAGGGGDLPVHPGGGDRERRRLVLEVPDLLQERLVRGLVVLGARVLGMPGVELALDLVASIEQSAVLRGEVRQQRLDPGPERLRLDTGPRQGLRLHELVQNSGNLQTSDLDAFRHL